MKKAWVVALALSASPVTAEPLAQAGLFSGWAAEASLALNPIFGESAPLNFNLRDDLIDEAGGEFYIRATRPIGDGRVKFRLQAGVTANPNFFDQDDVASVYYGQVSVGEADNDLTEFLARRTNSDGTVQAVRSDFQDVLQPYARYRYSRAFESKELFAVPKATDHRFDVGFRYRDIRGIMCTAEEARILATNSAGADHVCTSDKGLYVDIEPKVTFVESNVAGRERLAPSLRAQVNSRPILGVRAFAEAYGEVSFYDARVPAGDRRKDRTRRVTAGLDFSGPLTKWVKGRGGFLSDVTAVATIGPRWERRRSNQPDASYERWLLVPALSLTKPL